MPIRSAAELVLLRAAALAKQERHDEYNLAVLCITLHDELAVLHDWTVDQGLHDCESFDGACPVVLTLAKVNTAGPATPQTGKERMPGL